MWRPTVTWMHRLTVSPRRMRWPAATQMRPRRDCAGPAAARMRRPAATRMWRPSQAGSATDALRRGGCRRYAPQTVESDRAGTLSRFRPAAGPTRAHGRDSDCVGPGIGAWAGGVPGRRALDRGFGRAQARPYFRYRSPPARYLRRGTLYQILCTEPRSSSGERGSESARFG